MTIEPSASKSAVAVFLAEPGLTTMALNAKAGNGPTITTELRVVSLAMDLLLVD